MFKSKADQESDGICPVCKLAFTSIDRKVYDHGVPCSISSDPKKIYIMHDACNRRKADHTASTTNQLNEFFKEQDIL